MQLDPQSLKGTLLIQYKHDVNWLLGNLNKIGSIFVNGVRYPPEKNGGQGTRHSQSSNNQYNQDQRVGVGGTSPHLQHMANQVSYSGLLRMFHTQGVQMSSDVVMMYSFLFLSCMLPCSLTFLSLTCFLLTIQGLHTLVVLFHFVFQFLSIYSPLSTHLFLSLFPFCL